MTYEENESTDSVEKEGHQDLKQCEVRRENVEKERKHKNEEKEYFQMKNELRHTRG